MNRRKLMFLAALISVIFSSLFVILIPEAKAQGAGDAYFTYVEHSPKLYDGDGDIWNFTIYNEKCSVDIWGRAWFFFKFYIDDTLWWDEYAEMSYRTWQCNKGTSETRTYTIPSQTGPSSHDVKIELYWDYEGTPYLEGTHTFSFSVVKVFITDWFPSPVSVERGFEPATLSISFANGGNDYMYQVLISVVDTAGLEVSPQSNDLGNIIAGGTKTVSFSVKAPVTKETKTYTLTFQIAYNDFKGTTHTETYYADVSVTANIIRENLLYIAGGVFVVVVAITGAIIFVVLRRKKTRALETV